MKTITIRIGVDDLEVLKREASKLRISLSGLIRMKIAQAMGLEAQVG